MIEAYKHDHKPSNWFSYFQSVKEASVFTIAGIFHIVGRSNMGLRVCIGILLTASYLGFSFGANDLLIAPQVLREGVLETVVLNLHGVAGRVNVVASVNLGGVKNFFFNNKDATRPIMMRVKYDKPDGALETNRRQYVELLVSAKQTADDKKIFDKKLRMRLIENSGYIHVQTDRPIYRPEEVVKIRVIALTQSQAPENSRSVEIIVRIPLDNVGVEKKSRKMPPTKFIDTVYELPEYPVYGVWSIQARYLDQKVVKWATTTFEVRPYVIPTFNVQITLQNPYILLKKDMSNEYINGTITSMYSYGRKVSGSYYIVAKLKRPSFKKPVMFYQFPGFVNKKAIIVNGVQNFKIKATEVSLALAENDDFDTLEKEGASVIIEASVTGRAEGVIESDVARPVVFVRSPYKIGISRMSRYYTPGATFEIKADVVDSVTGSPVKKVDVVLRGPTTCGNLKCPENQCCEKNKCGGCKDVVLETDENGQINSKISLSANVIKLSYTLTTRDFDVPDENEGKLAFILHPYNSASKSFLQLSAVKKIAMVGENSFGIDIWYKTVPAELRYVILARGSIFSSGIHKPKAGSFQTNMKIKIEGEMVPSFKLFVYYLNGNEIVSNSLWVDVKDACKKEIEVVVPDLVSPGDHLHVEYTGSPGAVIGMSAVDRAAYFLYGESRLTRGGVFDNLNQYDEGCVREGGKNAQHVFEEGGLQLVGGHYAAKEDFTNHCDTPKLTRKKRGVVESLEAKFEQEAKLLSCKFDGKVDSLVNEDCKSRAKRVEDDESYECAEKFYEACKDHERLKKFGRSSARSGSANAGGFKAIASKARSNFEESMLWRTKQLGPDGKLNELVIAKDSITTFEFDTVSMHPTDGFCVAQTQNLTIFKDVFIQLKIPYALKRREQAEIRASIFNYGTKSQKITVLVKMGKDICSHFPEEKFSEVMTLEVDSNSAETTSFAVLPLRIPQTEMVEIEVKAVNDDNVLLDHIKRSILVHPEGEIKDIKGTYAIDLKNKPPGYVAEFKVEFRFPEHYTEGTRQCWLYPFSNFMGPIIEFDPVTKQPKNDVKNIIRMPGGCGEQTMLSMGPNVYAHKYLKAVGKMADGSAEEKGSIDKMKSGFANELNYRCNCNPKVWSVFPRWAPSVWLNAYVNKVFSQAKQFEVNMDMTPICDSVRWLVTSMQEADGGFKTGGRVIHQEMHGAVGSKLSLTAYVMMSLVESQSQCAADSKKVEVSIMKATEYLKKNKNDRQMEQPYALALVCYAMSVSNPNDPFTKAMVLKLLSKIRYSEDNRLAFWKGDPLKTVEGTGTHAYWYKRKPLAIDIEATGYALLSILFSASTQKVNQVTLDLTRKIVLWLIEQRDENGGFSTTQDTVVGLHALSEYMIWSNIVEPPTRDVDIELTINAPNGTDLFKNPIRIHLDKSNENSTTPIPMNPDVIGKGVLNIRAQGEGEGTLSYRCVYRTLVEEDSCHYDLSVSTQEYNENPLPGKDSPLVLTLSLLITKPRGEPSGQSIVEVNLISGYEAMENSLQKLSRNYFVDGAIERYEIANQKVILYLKEVTTKPIRLAFLISRTVYVKSPEPSSVTIYDYYEPTVRCSQFYGLPEDVPQLRTTPCENEDGMGGENICKCAEGGCLKCRTRTEQLEHTACLPGTDGKCQMCKDDDSTNCFNMTQMACKSNYVYTIKVTKGVENTAGVFVNFEAEITKVYKRGSDTNADKTQVRNFSTRTDCYQNCRDETLSSADKDGGDDQMIRDGRLMLVFGNENVEENLGKDGLPETKYRLNEGTYIERIYPDDKCKKARQKVDGECKKLGKKASKKKKENCAKQRGINQSCDNLKLLRRMLIRGCDNA